MTCMVFLNHDGEHYGQFPVTDEVGASIPLMEAALASWACDEQKFRACEVSARRDVDNSLYFELTCTPQSKGTPSLTILAGVFQLVATTTIKETSDD